MKSSKVSSDRNELQWGRDVLLFFRGRDKDTFVRGDHMIRRFLREATLPFRSFIHPRKQQITGYEMSFRLLCQALELKGVRVHINRRSLALRNPCYPIGISGFPVILEDWDLPNPAVLGPGLYDHPKRNLSLMDDPRFKSYLVKSGWMRDMFARYFGVAKVHEFFTGVDLEEWPDCRMCRKDIDFLIYDKIRWNRGIYEPGLLVPIIGELERRGLRYQVLRYGRYTLKEYFHLLERSRGMIFLCEHETQGHAWQESLACNVPVLAWDQGTWLDPIRPRFETCPVPATSVPGFTRDCGERFKGLEEFVVSLEAFLEKRASYTPRRWIGEELSQLRSAELYLTQYWAAGSGALGVSK